MPSELTLEQAETRLEKLLPDWQRLLVDEWEEWPKLWRKASGCSPRQGFYMRDRATELSMSHSSAILHWYQLGQISQEAAEQMLQPYLRSDLREKGVSIVLPLTYAQEDEQSGDGKVVQLFR